MLAIYYATVSGYAVVFVLASRSRSFGTPTITLPIDRRTDGKSPVYRSRCVSTCNTHVSQDLDSVPHRTRVGFMMFYCALVPDSGRRALVGAYKFVDLILSVSS